MLLLATMSTSSCPPPSSLWKWASLPPGELWTLHRAVYGLRVAPRKWPIERDASLTGLTWEVNGDTYYLKQCASDTMSGAS